ncbi:MAG: trypsin-like serine protease [Alphaproteobacteria bacterium]|nr:trypsin-like serine protease [Alphaproteobacteria bacterium]
MGFVLALALGALAAQQPVAAPTPSPAPSPGARPGIQGQDDRQAVEAAAYPWTSIGRLNNAGRGFCTAVLIAPTRVLTAAHCVRSHVAGHAWAPPGTVHFLAGYRRGRYLAHSQASAIAVAPAEPGRGRRKDGGGLEGRETDFAVVTLAHPMPPSLRPLPVEAFDAFRWLDDRRAGIRYTQAGYSGDRAHLLTRTPACSISGFDRYGRLFAHDCDATYGDSGSPILVRRGQGYAVVGLHVAVSEAGFGLAVTGRTLRMGLERLAGALPRPVNR